MRTRPVRTIKTTAWTGGSGRAARWTAALAIAGVLGCGSSDEEAAPGGQMLWGKRFGKSTSIDRVGLAVDSGGNAVVTGRFFATVDFGAGPVASPANNWQMFVAKYDPAGGLLWARSFGDIFEEQGTGVAVDGAGNIYLTGDFRVSIDFGGGPLEAEGQASDFFVAKLGPDGGHLWSKRFGTSSYDTPPALAVNARGDVALAGTFYDTLDLGTGPLAADGQAHLFAARLDPDGGPVFARALETGPGASAWYVQPTVAIDAGGDVTIARALGGTVDFGGGPLSTSGNSDLFAVALGPGGEHRWSKTFPSTGYYDLASSIAVGPGDTLAITGVISGSADLGGAAGYAEDYDADLFVLELGSDGGIRWARRFVAPGDQVGAGVAIDTFGDVLVTGGFRELLDLGEGPVPSVGGQDAFVAKLGPDGTLAWSSLFVNPGEQSGYGVGADAVGNVIAAGSNNGSLEMGDGALMGTSYYDQFLVELAR